MTTIILIVAMCGLWLFYHNRVLDLRRKNYELSERNKWYEEIYNEGHPFVSKFMEQDYAEKDKVFDKIKEDLK